MERKHFNLNENYASDFSDVPSEAEVQQKRRNRLRQDDELLRKPNFIGLLHRQKEAPKMATKRFAVDMLDKEEGKRMRYHQLQTLDAYNRHKKMVNDYLTLYGGKLEDLKRDSSKDRTDMDVIYENQKFLWDDEDISELTWDQRLAKRYWDKLYKEYTVCDLSLFKENKIGFRWRTEKEVISGKGQFSCGTKKCSEAEGLRSWEVNFAYMESGEKKNALVKSRLCAECSFKLNYRHKKKEVTGKPLKSKKSHKKSSDKKKKSKKKKSKHHDEEAPSSSSSNKARRDVSSSSGEEEIWKKPLQVETEKTREDEFDEYFSGMFL